MGKIAETQSVNGTNVCKISIRKIPWFVEERAYCTTEKGHVCFYMTGMPLRINAEKFCLFTVDFVGSFKISGNKTRACMPLATTRSRPISASIQAKEHNTPNRHHCQLFWERNHCEGRRHCVDCLEFQTTAKKLKAKSSKKNLTYELAAGPQLYTASGHQYERLFRICS